MKLAKTLTIHNDFHGTTCRCKPKRLDLMDDERLILIASLSDRQLARARRILCGIPDCTCGGIRGRQEHAGHKVIIQLTGESD